MKVSVTGATGVLGAEAVRALVAAGHDVVGLVRTPEKVPAVERWGATAVQGSLFDDDALAEAFRGADAVVSLATHIPVGYGALRDRAWRQNDLLRTEGVRRVVAAARAAGVRRMLQESVSLLYADQGDDWVDELSPLDITPATEPASVAEAHLQEYQCGSRQAVVLRFGTVVGDDPQTRWFLKMAGHGRPLGLGAPDGWAHLVHTDDVGPAVVAALAAPSGVYNVGAEPVRRHDLVAGYAEAAGQVSAGFLGPLRQRLAGARVEPLTRSLRVRSEHFVAQTGWTARRPVFDPSWFEVVGAGRGGHPVHR